MGRQKPLALCITGPTATGKTEVAVAVCKALQGEVIAMDSMQIYQKLSIGTASPSALERQNVPHHMLSIIPPDGLFTVYHYQQLAHEAMRQILQRGKLPVFCGGTGLYLQSILHPLSFTDAGAEDVIRKGLERELALPNGREALFNRLQTIDPESAKRLHPNNTRRVIRALEVNISTGRPMSAQVSDWETEAEEEYMVFALHLPRDVLYQRINDRVDRMIAEGLIEEVEKILQSGVTRQAQSMQAIGYREIIAMLMGECTKEEAIETIKRNTRRYAKRQLTWFRRNKSIQWIDRLAFDDAESIADWIVQTVRRGETGERSNGGTERTGEPFFF